MGTFLALLILHTYWLSGDRQTLRDPPYPFGLAIVQILLVMSRMAYVPELCQKHHPLSPDTLFLVMMVFLAQSFVLNLAKY